MKRRITAVIAALILMTSLAACGKRSPQDAYKEIYSRYSQMKSFYAAATVRVISDKGESEYAVRQFYETRDRFAFFVDAPEAVAGSGYVANNGIFSLKSGTGDAFDSKVAFPDSKNYMFVSDFFEEYYKSEETSVAADNGISQNKLVMECYTADRNPNRFRQSLTIDTKTYLPIMLTTYNAENKAVVEVEFHDFKRNADIDAKIFN